EAVEREQAREAQDGPAGALQLRPSLRGELSSLFDGGRESEGCGEAGGGSERVGEQPVRGGAGEGDQGAERAREGGDRVVVAEQAGRVRPGVGEHCLLERGERP